MSDAGIFASHRQRPKAAKAWMGAARTRRKLMTSVLSRCGFIAAGFGLSMAALLGAGAGSAVASPGCTSLNAGNVGAGGGVASGTGFDANDLITATPIAPGAIVVLVANGNVVGTNPPPMTVAALLAAQGLNFQLSTLLITLDVGGTQVFPTASISCVAASAPTNGSTESQKLQSLQASITPIVATVSAQAIGSSVDSGIGDVFTTGGTPTNFSATGGFINFAEIAPKSEIQKRTDEAFDALAYAGKGKPFNFYKAPPKLDREWSAWADIRGTGFKTNDANALGNDSSGRQLNLTGGIGRKLNTETLVGVLFGYEAFKYDVASLGATLKGIGETVGGYFARRIGSQLRFDAWASWSNVNYNAATAGANGSFTGSRWMASTGLTYRHQLGAFAFEPSAKIYALWENDRAWTDSTGTAQGSRNFSAGRTALGDKVSRSFEMANGWVVTPNAGLYADWRFQTNAAIATGTPVANIGTGWSARAMGGLLTKLPAGATLGLEGEYGGIGANYKIWTGNVRALVPF